LNYREWSGYYTASVYKVHHEHEYNAIRNAAALTPEMALRIEKTFGPGMDHLLRMQLAHDVAKTREHARRIPTKRYAPA
jgi:plasmid maintenance system antidote protein VapI